MSAKYLLPCPDGETVEVTIADAGRTITSPSGKLVTVPTLRALQKLPRAADSENRPAQPTWSAQQGAMFTIGICMLLAGLAVGGMLYNRWRQIETAKPEVNVAFLANLEKFVDSSEPANLLEGWRLLNTPLPEEREVKPWETNRAAAQRYLNYMGFAAVLALIGLGLAIAGPLLPLAATRLK